MSYDFSLSSDLIYQSASAGWGSSDFGKYVQYVVWFKKYNGADPTGTLFGSGLNTNPGDNRTVRMYKSNVGHWDLSFANETTATSNNQNEFPDDYNVAPITWHCMVIEFVPTETGGGPTWRVENMKFWIDGTIRGSAPVSATTYTDHSDIPDRLSLGGMMTYTAFSTMSGLKVAEVASVVRDTAIDADMLAALLLAPPGQVFDEADIRGYWELRDDLAIDISNDELLGTWTLDGTSPAQDDDHPSFETAITRRKLDFRHRRGGFNVSQIRPLAIR